MAEQKPPADGGTIVTAEMRRRRERYESHKRFAERELEKMRAQRQSSNDASKRKPKRFKGGTKQRTKSKSEVVAIAERTMVNQLVDPQARQHGDYRVVDFKLDEGTEASDRKEKAKSIRVVRNVGGTSIERWHSRGVFDDRQLKAILFYMDAYRKVFGEGPNVTASYSPVILRGLRQSVELYAGSAMAAKESLRLLDHEVFFREPFDHFCVWQNVVIYEKPAGVAGAGVGFIVKKSAEAAARVIVCGIAHKIADIVIDTSRRDFGDLLLDLDAPRRPGGGKP